MTRDAICNFGIFEFISNKFISLKDYRIPHKMRIKKTLIEFMVKHNLLPLKIKWEKNVEAVGSLYRNIFYMLDTKNRVKLTRMMEEWGAIDADKVVKELRVNRNIHGCAIAVLAFHQLFAIESLIVEETEDRVVIHITKCKWKDKKGWNPGICASIAAYETGMVRSINQEVNPLYIKRRSQGDSICELILTKKRK